MAKTKHVWVLWSENWSCPRIFLRYLCFSTCGEFLAPWLISSLAQSTNLEKKKTHKFGDDQLLHEVFDSTCCIMRYLGCQYCYNMHNRTHIVLVLETTRSTFLNWISRTQVKIQPNGQVHPADIRFRISGFFLLFRATLHRIMDCPPAVRLLHGMQTMLDRVNHAHI